MSTFYVLPSRAQLGRQVAVLLTTLFPGQAWDSAEAPDLAEAVAALGGAKPNVYAVFREDLPDASAETLASVCGAEAGDTVVEVMTGTQLADVAIESWQMEERMAPAA